MSTNPAEFRKVMSQFATGITVVTTCHDEEIYGLTVNAFCSVSLEPPLILVCINRHGRCHELILRGRTFAVNMLSQDQQEISERFAIDYLPSDELFAGIDYRKESTGAPILEGVIGWLECRLHANYAAGDHSIFVGVVLNLDYDLAMNPLVFFQSQYHTDTMEIVH